ncbi:GNAT family N-acetyltransferase [Paractinoplanes rishiriensis]|uniref:N-acetyltransferase n=1 Tax=Paractinoplanes rishiriensis TaxID=1050105 RepID=A0A919K2U0_9ACTN|nr:GNAT family N-acetyltransferase [Actinoplanes rishiriensis]GIE99193.1 N-acetyltransferase [Actinoplanes rishiriensis]
MHLAEVTPDNFAAAIALRIRDDQQDLVAPVVKSLAEAYLYPDYAWPRLIYDGDQVVGFLMAFLNFPRDDGREPRSGLWRLNIAADHQGQGYGRFAVQEVCAELRRRGATEAYVSWEPRAGGPEPFYRRLGFRPTGEIMGGQTVGVLSLGVP